MSTQPIGKEPTVSIILHLMEQRFDLALVVNLWEEVSAVTALSRNSIPLTKEALVMIQPWSRTKAILVLTNLSVIKIKKCSHNRCPLIISIHMQIKSTTKFTFLKVVEVLLEELYSKEVKSGALEEWQPMLTLIIALSPGPTTSQGKCIQGLWVVTQI